MSDDNLSSQISESILKVFKQTKLFEKFNKLNNYIETVIIISSILGLINLGINITNLYISLKNKSDLLDIQINIISITNKLSTFEKIIEHTKNTTYNYLNNQKEIMYNIMDIKTLLENSKKDVISSTISINSFSPVNSVNLINDLNYNVMNHKEFKRNENDDDELLDECYDIIPLNNLKKNTGLSWLFK